MIHGTSRAHAGRAGLTQIDLGDEPPLSVDGSDAHVIDRRRISVHWFSGTILTGLCGAALIGGAVFTSLDGETTFASLPDRVEGALRGALGGGERQIPSARKSDRLPPPSENGAARQIIRVSTAMRSGNREIMRVRPYIRVAGNLSLSVSDLSAKIPPFNAQRLLANADQATPVQASDGNSAESGEPDAEVSFVMRDLSAVLPRAKMAVTLPIENVVLRVREAAGWQGNTSVRYAVASAPSSAGIKLAYAAGGNIDPYAGFEARIVPENVTLLPKSSEQATGGTNANEHVHTVKKGESVASVLRDLGATPKEIAEITGTLGRFGRTGGVKEGDKLRVLMSAIDATQKLHPVRVIVGNDSAAEAIAALSDLGNYVAVDAQSFNASTERADANGNDDDENDDGSGVRLYQSIYETAMRNKIPVPVIDDMVRIYSFDVDFQRRVQAGDSFDVFYAGEEEGLGEGRNDVLYAALTVGGETKKYYRFQTPDDGVVDYYDESGKSAKKFLVRKPVTTGIMRSGFGARRHPILGYTKMHTGVDWAAPYGTPIFAAGNGTIEKAGWEGGYGKYVKIQHANGYETAYGHMSAYAKGIEPGKRVRQGQVIGYVGSTGLSTGAHVHYEIRVNTRFVDPMRIRLPRGRSLAGSMLARFEKERSRVEAMMNNGGKRPRVAQKTASAN